MSEQHDREWFGMFIPAVVWNHPELNCVHKCLYAEIHAVGGYKGECFASNEFLGGKVSVSGGQASRMIARLVELKLVKIVKFNGRSRWLKTMFDRDDDKSDYEKTNNQTTQNCVGRVRKNVKLIADDNSEEELEKEEGASRRAESFKPPVIQAVIARGKKIGLPESECRKFFLYYQSKDWMVGGDRMTVWCAALANWKTNYEEFGKRASETRRPSLVYHGRPQSHFGGNL